MKESMTTSADEVRVSLSEFAQNPTAVEKLVYEQHKRVLIMSGDRQVGAVATYGGDSGRDISST